MINTLITWLPNIATALLIACYVPQIYSNARYKKSNISLWFFILLIAALLTFTLYNVILFFKFGVFMGIITEGANSLLAIVVLIQVILIEKGARKNG
jgi:uncharacterized protein with PQ loop repeat